MSWHSTASSSGSEPNQDCLPYEQATSRCRRAASEAQVGNERSPRVVATAQDPTGTRSELPIRSGPAETLPGGCSPWQAGNVRVPCFFSTQRLPLTHFSPQYRHRLLSSPHRAADFGRQRSEDPALRRPFGHRRPPHGPTRSAVARALRAEETLARKGVPGCSWPPFSRVNLSSLASQIFVFLCRTSYTIYPYTPKIVLECTSVERCNSAVVLASGDGFRPPRRACACGSEASNPRSVPEWLYVCL